MRDDDRQINETASSAADKSRPGSARRAGQGRARTALVPHAAVGGREAAIEAVVHGDCGDPFAVLGLHFDGPDGAAAIRVFLPDAIGMAVIDGASGAELCRLEKVHPAGFWAGLVPGRRSAFAYRLRSESAAGVTEFEDAYRFPPVLGELDVHLLAEGTHLKSYERLGAHLRTIEGVAGAVFAVWAPSASRVSVVGDFCNWDGRRLPMRYRHECGVWELFVPGVGAGALYKYEIKGLNGELLALKADPYGFYAERPPRTASIVHDLGTQAWTDAAWLQRRGSASGRDAPISIYEVHLGSWRRVPEEGGRFLTYDELADRLVPYAKEMGFSHIELLPVTEHPFDGSWGYQPVGLYAPTSRFGEPAGFARFVDRAHREGLGVLIDWVPGHFPTDPHGLGYFDGTHLYEHADPRQGFHQDWQTLIYNYGRREVRNYLFGNALFWLDRYHVDGLRVDAVASMLYLDYSRRPGEWIPNLYGGNENLDAIAFLKRMNELVYGAHASAMTVAEESTAWPGVSRPTYLGGLGFGYKWNMGWMHDTLAYMAHDPVHRRWHHNGLTFGLLYAFSENFVLPLSHDEVVHGKGSLLGKMPGDRWQRFANLRAYYGFMFGHPGKKLLFMGGEIAQEREWSHDRSLDWHLLADPLHRGVQHLVRDLNRLYRELPALHEQDFEPAGFEWLVADDYQNSVVVFLRRGREAHRLALVACNFTPVPRLDYRVGVPNPGFWRERLNSDAAVYGGSNLGNGGGAWSEEVPSHGHARSLRLILPPLATLVFEWQPG
ncbi:MAG TPA: 1,4-alpha-glucan branching protein GlgB [Alphaproteobacteria bacterium]|nr:1,4-alpha-glucan branching protein GlgB [Alphaproteobacteria bacterium]